MKGVLICPDARKEVAFLARLHPLVLTPFLGKPLLDHAIAALAESGITDLTVLASDRPDEIRQFVNDGQPWGIRAVVMSEPEELSIAAARKKHVTGDGWADAPTDVVVLDRLPDKDKSPVISSYRSLLEVMERELNSFGRIHVGGHEYQPGVWTCLKTKISDRAVITAPCWIGDHV
jgi:hypothetical protein